MRCCTGATPTDCLRRFGRTFVTPLRIDRGHVLANVGPVLASLRHEGGLWPFLVGAAAIAAPRRTRASGSTGSRCSLFGLSVLPGLCSSATSGPTSSRAATCRFPPSGRSRPRCTGSCSSPARWPDGSAGWCSRSASLALVVAVPPAPRDPLAEARADAARLAAAGPAVLLADYLDVYVPASLAPPGVLVPIGAEGNLDRFPGTVAELRPGMHGSRAVRARPAGWDAGAARRAPPPRRGPADPRAPGSLVPARRGAGRGTVPAR